MEDAPPEPSPSRRLRRRSVGSELRPSHLRRHPPRLLARPKSGARRLASPCLCQLPELGRRRCGSPPEEQGNAGEENSRRFFEILAHGRSPMFAAAVVQSVFCKVTLEDNACGSDQEFESCMKLRSRFAQFRSRMWIMSLYGIAHSLAAGSAVQLLL